jgi:hypothetical protein
LRMCMAMGEPAEWTACVWAAGSAVAVPPPPLESGPVTGTAERRTERRTGIEGGLASGQCLMHPAACVGAVDEDEEMEREDGG